VDSDSDSDSDSDLDSEDLDSDSDLEVVGVDSEELEETQDFVSVESLAVAMVPEKALSLVLEKAL